EAQELETCFRAHASYLFGRACVLTCGDQALAHDLVQAAFEAAAMTWQALEDRPDEQRRSWLHGTMTNIAVNGFRREAAFRARVRHKLLAQLGGDYPFDGGTPEGALS